MYYRVKYSGLFYFSTFVQNNQFFLPAWKQNENQNYAPPESLAPRRIRHQISATSNLNLLSLAPLSPSPAIAADLAPPPVRFQALLFALAAAASAGGVVPYSSPVGAALLPRVNVAPAKVTVVKQPYVVTQTEAVYRPVPVPVRAVAYAAPVAAAPVVAPLATPVVAAPAAAAPIW